MVLVGSSQVRVQAGFIKFQCFKMGRRAEFLLMSFILHALGYGRSVFPHLLVILASTGATAPKSPHADTAGAAAIVRVIAPQSRISVPRVKTATRARDGRRQFDLGKGSSEHGKLNPLKARQCTSKLNRTLLDVCYSVLQ